MSTHKAPSIFADGWTQEKANILSRTRLPEKLRCKQCKKLKSVPGFSQRQLGIAKQSFAKNPKLNEQGIAIAVCRQCTEGQVMELECSQCNLIKSLEGFTKAQRRDPDFARCIECVNDHLDQPTANDPTAELRGQINLSDDDLDEDDGYESDGRSNPYASDSDNDSSASALASQTQGLRVNDEISTHGSLSSQENDKGQSSWKKWAEKEGGEGLGPIRGVKNPTTYTLFDEHGKAHSRVRAPSSVAGSTPPTAPRSNFPRIRACKPPPESAKSDTTQTPIVFRSDGKMQVPEPAQRAHGRQRESRDSDSDSDFGCL